MQKHPGQTYEIRLTGFAYGGEAIGRLPDGRAVFVPFALPGEQVRIRLVEEKRGHARAELLDVLEVSPARGAPRCLHFGECGGCHYQHMPYPAQLAAKQEILRDQLMRIGGLSDPPVEATVACPAPYGYRNHVQFHLTPSGQMGYYKANSRQLFAIQECHLPQAPIAVVWPQLEFEALPELERIGLRLGTGDDLQLILESSDPQPPDFSVEDLPISAVHLSSAGTVVLAGSDYVIFEVLDRRFRVSAGSFFQVNTLMAETLVEHLLAGISEFHPLNPQTVLLDVYCGVGLFSAFLANRAGQLIGIEASPSACEDFVANLDEFDNVELYEDRAELALSSLDVSPEVILVDPPRAGLDRGALDAILTLKPALLVYVSCDPATLGRDARRLAAGGYSLARATPLDLFPQTYHIESLSFWLR